MNDRTQSLFLSTAIPYVNAAPHVGHAFELVLGDALSRHHRQRGRPVFFSGGTDDHSIKNARAAALRGVSTAELVAEHAAIYRRLHRALDIELDGWLRTSNDPRHLPAVTELWRRCGAAGDLYQSDYSGLYCGGCEAFVSEAELVNGGCALHPDPLELVEEANWFFRLSRYEPALLAALESDALRVEPRERHNEVVSFVRSGLRDFSVSRSHVRARGWGFPVPGDPSQVVYVWFDALANYLSVLGFPDPTFELERYWHGPSSREHLIGKDVLRFHAVYWPALLASAGLPLPDRVKVHGFVTVDGNKIGKSLGNGFDPFTLVDEFGSDVVRYYLLRHLHSTKDSDFRLERVAEAHASELAGKLGNLLQRTTAIAVKHRALRVCRAAAPTERDQALADAAARALSDVVAAVDDFALHEALTSVFALVAAANRYADGCEPWALSRRIREKPDDDCAETLGNVLWHLLEALRVSAVLLAPFAPKAAVRICERLGVPQRTLASLDRARFGDCRTFAAEDGPALFPLERDVKTRRGAAE